MIHLHVEPSTPPMDWEEFCVRRPYRSVALDGYVHGGPRWNIARKQVNFNHHEDVDRLATRSTCAQVLMAFRQGLDRFLRTEDGRYHCDVFVNDCDEDVSTSVWMLGHPHLVAPTMNPRLNRLVHAEDMLDATAGAYPYPSDLPLLGELAWVFEPYRSLRSAGRLGDRNEREYRGVIDDVGRRIEAHLMGTGRSLPLDTRFDTVQQESTWIMIARAGAHARTELFGRGCRAFVEVRQRGHDATIYDYTVGRMAPFVDFPLPGIFDALNVAECTVGMHDCWGGGDVVGGSPRVAGSKLQPSAVGEIVKDVVRRGAEGSRAVE